MRTIFDKKLSREKIKLLGLGGAVQSVNDAGFIDFAESKNPFFINAYLDLENIGTLKAQNPKLVTRDLGVVNDGFVSSKTYRSATESEYFYTTYKIIDATFGNISFTDLSSQTYNAADNNFFKPFNIDKIKKSKNNNFQFARFRFPKDKSNTLFLHILTPTGTALVKPAGRNTISKKTYYKWNHNLLDIPSGSLNAQDISINYINNNSGALFADHYIPYPTTLDLQNYTPYNIPTCIAPKLNKENNQYVNGLLAISIGSANQKEIVYVSPHSMQTGIFNTAEEFNRVTTKVVNLYPGSKSSYATVSGAGFAPANGIYKQVIAHPSSGYLPRFRNIMPSGVSWTGNNPQINKKEIYWDNYNWNISVNNVITYKSPSQISININPRPFIDSVAINEMNGIYTEISGSSFEYERVWEKNISISGRFNPFRKSILFWDPTQGLYALGSTIINDVYASIIPNYYQQTPYSNNESPIFTTSAENSGTQSPTNAYFTGLYQKFSKIQDRGQRRGKVQPKFFDGWHLPYLSGATFLNSWVLPYISGKTSLATGNFIAQGNRIITGATFWSGFGFQYVTGQFYNENGQLFSGQVITGSGVEYFNETRYRNIPEFSSGIITGEPSYSWPSNWTTGIKYVTGYSGTNYVSINSGSGLSPFVSGQVYWYPKTYLAVQGLGIPFNTSGLEIINNVVYLSGKSYSGYVTGSAVTYKQEEYLATACISGNYQKYASPIFSGANNTYLLYDNSGDYNNLNQWILIHETNSNISGQSGYTLLFKNNKTPHVSSRNYIPRVCWWQGSGQMIGSGLHINHIPAPITGGYSIARIPAANSGYKINSREFLNLLSSDNGDYLEFGVSAVQFLRSPRMLYIPSPQTGLTPSTSVMPRNNSFPVQITNADLTRPIVNNWLHERKYLFNSPIFGYLAQRSVTSHRFGNYNVYDIPYWNSQPSGIGLGLDGASTYAPSPKVINGAFYQKQIVRKEKKLIQVKGIDLDSRYINNGKVLPSGYVVNQYQNPYFEYPTYVTYTESNEEVGINTDIDSGVFVESGFIINNEYIPAEQVLQNKINIPVKMGTFYSGGVVEPISQKIPLKDTLFYKLYNHLYDGSKTLATGTWDGIIPSGSYFAVEIISTHFNDNFGTVSENIESKNLGVFYAGDNQDVKSKIDNVYGLLSISGAYPKVHTDAYMLSYTSHAANKNLHASKIRAKNLARQKMQIIYNKAAKENFEEILFKNMTYNKMQKFLVDQEAEKLFTGYISPFSQFDVTKYIIN